MAKVSAKNTNTAEKTATSSFAIIATGGKQYKVAAGDVIKVEKLNGDFKEGDKVVFDNVLLTDNGSKTVFGAPIISGGTVEGTFKAAGRHAKVVVIHYKQKSRYFKKNGHRQPYSEVEITKI